PAVGPNGEIYVVWENLHDAGLGKILFDLSLDGGRTWKNRPPAAGAGSSEGSELVIDPVAVGDCTMQPYDCLIQLSDLNLNPDPFNNGFGYDNIQDFEYEIPAQPNRG